MSRSLMGVLPFRRKQRDAIRRSEFRRPLAPAVHRDRRSLSAARIMTAPTAPRIIIVMTSGSGTPRPHAADRIATTAKVAPANTNRIPDKSWSRQRLSRAASLMC